MRWSAVLLATGLLLAGCAKPVTRQAFDVGVFQVSVATGPDWRHVDQGRRHLLRHDPVQLVIEDLGPVGRDGIRREIERARTLWRRGQVGEARSVMTMIPVASELFATPEHRRAFWDTWNEVSSAPDDIDAVAAGERFDRLLDAVAALRERPADQVIDDALATMGEDQRRRVAWRQRRMVSGRDAVVIQTWNRLSHDHPRRFALIMDSGRLLVLRTEQGPWQPALVAFDPVLRSLRVTSPPAPDDDAGGTAPGERDSSDTPQKISGG